MSKNPRATLKHKSFELVYRDLALPLMKFLVKRLGGNTLAAEEVFSDTVFAAYKGWHTFEHKSSYFTWICKIGIHKIADYYRKQIHEQSRIVAPLLEEIADSGSENLSFEERLILREVQSKVKECLMLLPEEKRRLLYLRFYKELSVKKIAQIMGVSERSVEGKIYRAKNELKMILSKEPEFALLKDSQ